MIIKAIKTHLITSGESLFEILDRHLPKIKEKTIITIASKVVSYCEKNLIKKSAALKKTSLIKKEADQSFPAAQKNQDFFLTLKDHRLIPNAGIDESNCKNHYLLLPKNPQLTAKKIWEYLRKRDQIKNLGVIITDCGLTPLRSGVSGIAIGWCGFSPIYSYIGQRDLFGNLLKVTKVNLIDNLATAAILVTGDGNEQTPIAIITKLPSTISFKEKPPTKKDEREIYIDTKEDLFSTILKL